MLRDAREKFLEFFKKHDHLIIDSAPLVPENDPTLLFINSGMAPLKRYFLQEATPPATRLVNSQHCLRVGGKHNDLADVGYTKRHHTFFEMLGNFSFGDYFQKEVIPFAWDFLTNTFKIDPSRLYITTHPDDKEAFDIWKNIVGANRITQLQENVWSMGDIGPFGYCSEIFYDQQIGQGNLIEGDRYLEIWNLVFMKFYSDGKNKSELPKPCIDAGMGLERIVSVLEGVNDTYDISFFKNVLPILGASNQTVDTKIFLDHLRSAAFLINEGVLPGASGRDYVVRRIIRRGLKSFFTFDNLNLLEVSGKILTKWQEEYDTDLDIPNITKIINQECLQFHNILENGMRIFEEIYAKNKLQNRNDFSAQELFLLHDTYGFSVDIALDLLKTRQWNADITGYEALMEETKEKGRGKSMNILLPYPTTIYLDEEETGKKPIEANILGFYEDNVILDKTPFYAESGGQIGDTGQIIGQDFELKILDTKKLDKVYIHKFEKIKGEPKFGKVSMDINHAKRGQIRAHHSATHLLHQALCDIFGDHIKQMGSYVAPDRLRLDFNHQEQITREQIIELENIVNGWIRENHVTQIKEMALKEAVSKGAKAFFTYDDKVRTIKFGNRSFELCGGSHVQATGDIGLFIITKISAISAGTKRIEAVCAAAAIERMHKIANLCKDVAQFLNVDEDSIMHKLKNISEKSTKQTNNQVDMKIQIKNVKNLNIGYIIGENIEIEKQMQQHKLDILCVCSENNGKISLQLKRRVELVNLNAKDIMQRLGSMFGAAGCGGRADFAQTGFSYSGFAHANFMAIRAKIFQQLCEIIEILN